MRFWVDTIHVICIAKLMNYHSHFKNRLRFIVCILRLIPAGTTTSKRRHASTCLCRRKMVYNVRSDCRFFSTSFRPFFDRFLALFQWIYEFTTISKPFLNLFYTISRPFLDFFKTIFYTISRSFLDCLKTIFYTISRPVYDHFQTISRPFLDCFKTISRPFHDHF